MCSSESGGQVGAFSGASDDLQVHKILIQTYTVAATVGHLRAKFSWTFVLEMRCDGVLITLQDSVMAASKSDFGLKEKQKILLGFVPGLLPACLGLPPAM